MVSKTTLDAIHPHIYGLKAASACDSLIAQIEAASIPEAISIINQILDPDKRDRAMAAFINYTSTGDRDELANAIKGYEYLAAHLHLGKFMNAFRLNDEMDQVLDYPLASINTKPDDSDDSDTDSDDNFQPAITAIIETLTESIQASNAPSAAVTSELQPIH